MVKMIQLQVASSHHIRVFIVSIYTLNDDFDLALFIILCLYIIVQVDLSN